MKTVVMLAYWLFVITSLCPGQEQGSFFIKKNTSQEIKAIDWNELIFQDKFCPFPGVII
jgi:hypothetical protein